MVIQTKEFGFVEIDAGDIIVFPHGIYGFEKARRFVLLHDRTKQANPFMWLQCVDEREPCFAVLDPRRLFADYRPEPSPEAFAAISLQSQEHLRYLVIATVPGDIRKLSLNLKCPIVINAKDNIAMQVILENSDYPMRYYLFENGGV